MPHSHTIRQNRPPRDEPSSQRRRRFADVPRDRALPAATIEFSRLSYLLPAHTPTSAFRRYDAMTTQVHHSWFIMMFHLRSTEPNSVQYPSWPAAGLCSWPTAQPTLGTRSVWDSRLATSPPPGKARRLLLSQAPSDDELEALPSSRRFAATASRRQERPGSRRGHSPADGPHRRLTDLHQACSGVRQEGRGLKRSDSSSPTG